MSLKTGLYLLCIREWLSVIYKLFRRNGIMHVDLIYIIMEKEIKAKDTH